MLDSLFGWLGLAVATPTLPPLENISPAPIVISEVVAPVVAAESALVVDLDSGRTLFEKNADEPRAVASLTKLATTLAARELFELDEVVTVSANAAKQPPAKIWLLAGEQISVRDLLAASLIESGNDAATALAEHAGTEAFLAKMNEVVANLGLPNTNFVNPTGLDAEDHLSSARDIALLGSAVLRDPVLREFVATNRMTVRSTDGKIPHPLVSTNILHNSPNYQIIGLKTGSTDEAGACLAAISVAPDGRRTLAIVLNSPERFRETKNLLDWAEREVGF